MPAYKISLSWIYDPVAKTIQKEGHNQITHLDPSASGYSAGDDYARRVDVYEDRVRSWFLDYARDLDLQHDAGFVVLMLCCAYIEGVEQFRSGNSSDGKSQAYFIRSAERILAATTQGAQSEDWSLIYQAARCGLFHVGMTPGSLDWKPRILTTASRDAPVPMAGKRKSDTSPAWLFVDNNSTHSVNFYSAGGTRTAVLSPREMQKAIRADFEQYLVDLRSPGHGLAANFKQRFLWP